MKSTNTAESRIRLVSTPGGRLFVDEADAGSVTRALLRKGRYEKAWTTWLQGTIRPGMRALDIGANVGYYTALLAHLVGPSGSVVACEPDPHNCDLLRRSMGENAYGHVEIVEAAVSDRVGRATLYHDAKWHGVHSLARENCVNQSDSAVEVATVTVDGLMGEARRAFDFVKVDAQGAESRILSGAEALLAQPHLTLLMEVWPYGLHSFAASVDTIAETFLRQGFLGYTLETGPELTPIDRLTLTNRAETLGQWSSFNVVWMK